ncbi:hypothetical protein P280DRAFT_551226 [Massarina eburnea CBS 473.64]|uniref:Uncharacterized protein n=1 Tax=Massarina eburnea CBS 473.64 TaxID=1395130 RepID=A0A6A6RXA6_9PLEO|nr:hypothetical protein P280DRAFT_551226 [Massarina eburnea CBS 473.64]
MQDICGADAADCGKGFCCSSGMKCVSSSAAEPQCNDLISHGVTVSAIAWSSLATLLNLDPLTSLGLTISTFPHTTMTGTTALPTYSDNVISTTAASVPSKTDPGSALATAHAAGARSGTGVVDVEVLIGAAVGVGMVLGL